MEKTYTNLGYFFLILIVFVGLGFYYPYFSLFPQFKSITALIHIHTIALMLWVCILIAQPLLIRYQKYKPHKILGRVTYFLMPVVIITLFGVVRKQYNEGIEQKMTPFESFETVFTSFAGIFTILIYYLCAIFSIRKGNVALHMRWMICLFLEFIPPTFGRTLGYWFGIRQLYTYSISIGFGATILILLVIADKKKKMNYAPYLVALSLYVVVNAVWLAIGHPI